MAFLKYLKNEILRLLATIEDLRSDCTIYFRNRPSNKLTNGDILLQFSGGCKFKENSLQEVLDVLSKSPTLSVAEEWKITAPRQVAAKLRRSQVVSRVLEDVQSSGSRYGYPSYKKVVAIRGNVPSTVDPQDISNRRLRYVYEHIYTLLTSCCSTVCRMSEETKPPDPGSSESLDLLNKARNSAYIHKPEENNRTGARSCGQDKSEATCNTVDLLSDVHGESSEAIVLDLKKYLTESNLPCGCFDYDRSIHFVPVLDVNRKWSQQFADVLNMESVIKTGMGATPNICVHVTSLNSAFMMQNVDLLWQIIGQCCPSHQVHCAVAPVQSSNLLSWLELKRQMMSDLELVSAHKYGSIVGSDDWKQMLEQLAYACIKFCLLSTSLQRPVKLDLGNSDSLRYIKSGSFVMYNYARLSTLLDQFTKCVYEQTYPALPSIDAVDWSLLKKEEEWNLLWQYVAYFPVLLEEIVSSVLNEDHVQGNFPIHKLYIFALNMSHAVSTYYSSVHVLVSPLPHLLPQMYARLHLLRAVHQVMETIFFILNIVPLRQM